MGIAAKLTHIMKNNIVYILKNMHNLEYIRRTKKK